MLLKKYADSNYARYLRELGATVTLESPDAFVELAEVWESLVTVLDTERDIFIKGGYGSGKTATMRKFAEELKEEGRVVSHVVDRGLRERQIIVAIARPFLSVKELKYLRIEDLIVRLREALNAKYEATGQKSIIILEDLAENDELGVRRVINVMDSFSQDGVKSAQFYMTGTEENFDALRMIAPLIVDRLVVLSMPRMSLKHVEELLRTRFPDKFPFSDGALRIIAAEGNYNPRDILEIAQLACKIAAEEWVRTGSTDVTSEMIKTAAEWRQG